MHGTWLGHPLHPVLTDLPLGAWTAALVFDGLDLTSHSSDGYRAAARVCVELGLVGALGAAATGLVDWQHTHDQARRVGVVHGLLTAVAPFDELAEDAPRQAPGSETQDAQAYRFSAP